jgi:GntR family transcriptional regulator
MGVPAYQDVAAAIRADITARRLVEGDRLPTVRDLATRYGVPTGTVARALDVLRGDGVIVSRHGRGLYVRSFTRIVRSSPGRLSRAQWGKGKSIQDHDTNGRLRVVNVEVGEVPAPDWVAEALHVPHGAAVLSRARRFAVEDRIVQTATSYLPLDVVAAAPSVAYTEAGRGGIYNRMREAGVGPERFTETVVCRMPTTVEASELALPGGTPVVAITRHAYTGKRRCVEVNVMVLDASAYVLEYAFTADP